MSNGSDIILNVKVNLQDIEAPEKIFSSLKSAMNSAINESFKNAKINLNSSINVQSNKNEKNTESSTDKALKDFLTFGSSILKELSKINNTLKNTTRENLRTERKKENYDKKYFEQIKDAKARNKIGSSFLSGLTQLGVATGILSDRDIKKGLKYGNLLAERYTYRVYDKNGNLTDKRRWNISSTIGDVFAWGKALYGVVTKIYDTLKKNYEQVSTQVELFKNMLETSEKEVDLSNYLTRAESFGHLNTVNALATHSDISLDKALEIGKDFYNNEENLLGFGKYKNINGTEFEGAEVKYKTDSENIIALVQAAVQGIVDMQTKDGAITSVRLTKEQQAKRMKELSRNGISSFDIKNFLQMQERESNGKFDMNNDRIISAWNYTGDRTLMEQKRNEVVKKWGEDAIENYDRKTAETKNKYLKTQDFVFIKEGEKNLQKLASIFDKEIQIRREYLGNFESISSGKLLTLLYDYFNAKKDIALGRAATLTGKSLINEYSDAFYKLTETDSSGKSFKNKNAVEIWKNKELRAKLQSAIEMDKKMSSLSLGGPGISFTDYFYDDIERELGIKLTRKDKKMLKKTIATEIEIQNTPDAAAKELMISTHRMYQITPVEQNLKQQTDYQKK